MSASRVTGLSLQTSPTTQHRLVVVSRKDQSRLSREQEMVQAHAKEQEKPSRRQDRRKRRPGSVQGARQETRSSRFATWKYTWFIGTQVWHSGCNRT